MILESVEFFHLGPFEPDAVIRFEPGLTVLVGPNDAGKSRVLRYLELMLNRQPITEDDLPTHYRVETPWDGDPAIRAVARFRVTDTTRLANNASDLQPHDVAVVEFRLAPKQSRDTVVLEIVRGGQKIPLGGNTLYAEPFPVVTQFPTNPELRPVMHLDDLRREELMLLRLAFGPNPVPVLRSFSSDRAVEELHEAGEKISARLNQYLPENLRLEFILSPLFDDETLTSVLLRLRDRAKARVGLQRRGSGLQKLLGILIAFLSDGFTDRRRVLLLDEPETHLHPNGQHALRYYLEELSQHPNLQVIYATHSSAMVNPFKASSIRVVERVTENDRGRSVIREEAVDDNFLLVRTSLGVSPLDSLLYAPVCLLVEGPTEAHVLPRLLRHALDDAREPVLGEGMSIEQLLAFCHIVSGGGSNWPKWVRLIESQRAHAVVFVDGDMARNLPAEFRRDFPHVPVVYLDPGDEIEDLVPHEFYFRALSQIYGKELSQADMGSWATGLGNPREEHFRRRPFSKQVGWWLSEAHSIGIDKPEVMRKAVDLALEAGFALSERHRAKLVELVEHLAVLAKKLVSTA